MIVENLLRAESLPELGSSLESLATYHWRAHCCHYLLYDENRQLLTGGGKEWSLSSLDQVGNCVQTLRPCSEQALPWPEGLEARGRYRMVRPIFHWGTLTAVLCLGFEQEPEPLQSLKDVELTLGILSDKLRRMEMTEQFVGRSRELLVQAVEARGKSGHIQRTCRLTSSLAKMLDCSPQSQAVLLEAAQSHDLGLLTFADPQSPEARRDHARIGSELLRCHPDLFEVAELVETHHERYDGSGQPRGAKENELPLECWILALVEDFVEHWESSLDTYQNKVRDFFLGPAKHHHPDAVDALCGLVDSEKLQEIMS